MGRALRAKLVPPCTPQKGQHSLYSFPDEIKECDPFTRDFLRLKTRPFFVISASERNTRCSRGPSVFELRRSISEIISFPGKARPSFRPSKHGVARYVYIERTRGPRVTFSPILTLNGSLFAPLCVRDSECRPFYFDSPSTRGTNRGGYSRARAHARRSRVWPRSAVAIGFVNGLRFLQSRASRKAK